MRAIEVTINVSGDGSVEIEAAPDLLPGRHQVLLIVDQTSVPPVGLESESQPDLVMLDWSAWPADSTFRREDLYGDDGR